MRSLLVPSLILGLTSQAAAHQAPVHEHATLVPIPDYSQPYGEASATAANQAAAVFLDSLDAEQQAQALFAIDAAERSAWSNLPAGIVERTGLSVGELSDAQRSKLFEFLASSLGEEGYQSVMEVMAAESFLSTDKRAKRLKWDPENYWISFYGMPGEADAWGWQYGGHHLGLNLSVDGERISSMSPSFVGTEPAVFTLDGVDYEAVRDMHLSGYAVYQALDSEQQQQADAGAIPEDVLTGPGEDGTIPPVIGLSAANMNDAQKNLLLAAVAEWVSIQPDEEAAARMAELTASVDSLAYAWSGNDEVNTPTYMRIQGPNLIIEMLSTGGNVGESASGQGHYHTIYRNPNKEYGG